MTTSPSSSVAGLSKHFKAAGVPALQVYKASQLLGSFVRMTNKLGMDLFAPDVESVLSEHGLLPDHEAAHSRIRGPAGGRTATPPSSRAGTRSRTTIAARTVG